MLAFILLGLLLGGTATDAAEAELAAQSLVGQWRATLVHAGQRETMRIEIAPGDGDAALVARLSLPAIDLRDLALGPVTFEDDLLRAGPFEMTWDRTDQTLSGVLPSAFVPVISIPFELRRSAGGEAEMEKPPTAREGPRVEPAWIQRVGGAVWAGLAVTQGKVLIGADDGVVVALSTSTGALIWRFETGGAIRARPIVEGDVALVHSDDGFLYALSLEDGTERWRARLGPASTRKPLGVPGSRYEHFASSPTVVGDRIYVANAAGELLCLDRQRPEVIWRFKAGDSINSTPAVAGGKVFVASFDHHVYAVDQATGAEVWSRDTGEAVPASPVVVGELVLIGGRSYELLALHAQTGKIAWSRYFWFSWVEATAAVHDGLAYVGLSDGQLVTAFDAGTGEEIWRFDTGGSVWSEPAATESTLFVGAVGVPGYFVNHLGGLFAVERVSGRELWRFPIDSPEGEGAAYGFAAAPAVGHGRVFAATVDGEVFAFDTE